MKIKSNLSLNAMGDEFVVVSDDPKVFRGMIKLNQSGAFVFELLEQGFAVHEIADKMVEIYEVDKATAASDLDEFIETFRSAGLVEDDE